jgi:glycerophosphoryl diester phosphodiesterase
MVGNHYYRDVEGAKQAGMTAIWFHWNDRYPSQPGAPAADYTATDATELAAVIGAWLASLDRPYVAAHRGARRLAPENTLPAFSAALESGGSALELDVHLTRDERIVVIHDDLLERTTDGHGPVSALTSAEIDSLDAGSWFGPAFSGTRVPYLEEVISLAQRFDARLHVELKGARAWLLADRVVEMVRKMGAVESAVIMSFDLNAVLAAARSGPEIPTLAIVSGPLRKQLDFVLSTGLSGLNQSVSLWDEATIGTFHQHGLIAHGSLVNDREELDAFFAKGGDMADSDSMDCLGERVQ